MKKFIFLPLAFLMLFNMTQPALANSGHWAEIPLKYMVDNGYLQATNGDTRPDEPLTRLEAARAIAKLPLINKGSNYIFTDTCDADVVKVAKSGIMNGCGNQIFNPNASITREETAKILAMMVADNGSVPAPFSDYEEIATWARPFVSALYAEKIVVGFGDNTFRPKNTITRAEFATAFMKIRDKYDVATITANTASNAPVTPLQFIDIPSGCVGVLSIPSLGLNNLPVVEDGENLDNIKNVAGHFINTAIFDGNVGLLGHNFTDKSPWFGKLANIQNGAEIVWKTKYGIRRYSVITKQDISATDWSSLAETGDNRLTIITCLAGHSETTRIMVQGKEKIF